jgi:hypothetical protein
VLPHPSRFAGADTPAPRSTQYFELLGSRSIVHGQWKATTDHVSHGVLDEEALLTGSRRFEDDHWALFDLTRDFAEATDVSAEHPDLVASLADRWQAEADRNQVMPIEDSLLGRISALAGPAWPPGDDRVFRPGGGPVRDESVPILAGGFLFSVDVEVAEEPEGVLFALGDWNGGYALFVTQERLAFSLSRGGELLEVTATRPLARGASRVGVAYRQLRSDQGTFILFEGEEAVGELVFDGGLPFVFQHGGAGLRLGYDAGLPVSPRYRPPFRWNGMLGSVRLRTGAQVPDPATLLRGALHAD